MRGWGSHLWTRVRLLRGAGHWAIEVRDDDLGHGYRTRCGMWIAWTRAVSAAFDGVGCLRCLQSC